MGCLTSVFPQPARLAHCGSRFESTASGGVLVALRKSET